MDKADYFLEIGGGYVSLFEGVLQDVHEKVLPKIHTGTRSMSERPERAIYTPLPASAIEVGKQSLRGARKQLDEPRPASIEVTQLSLPFAARSLTPVAAVSLTEARRAISKAPQNKYA